ncbi:MAG TPA: hypothetical protein VD884_15665 [Ohtaekwangia sp.]|nr:hypothetical protein [Ohtaekwangia sp.]
MKQEIVEHEILEEVMKLLEKAAFDAIAPMPSSMENSESHSLESSLITLRNLNARYDKDDAVSHIRSLMHRYNIQLDELMDSRGVL